MQGLVTLLSGLLTPPDMVSVTSAPGNVALAAPAPIPDTDLEDVLGAVQAAAERVLTDVDNLPDDVQELVRNVARNPQSLPLEVAKLVDRAIDTVKVAGDTVGLAVVGTLPEDLRAPAAALPLALGGAADDIRIASWELSRRSRRCVTQAGGGPQLQRLSGTGPDHKGPGR